MTAVDVELVNVVKEFPGSGGEQAMRAVDDVSLKIYDSEFFALLGPSGCGKTTTLRMIAGFEYPTQGKISIRGQSMEHVPPYQRPVNTVFQDYALFPHMNVLQNVMFGLRMEGIGKNEAKQRAMEALELVRLPDAANRNPRHLSGGQQQRVALARALVKKPAVLLLDEPLGALDLKLRKEMQYELKSMQRQVGITFIYVTHDQEEAMTMADRIAVMNEGKLLQVGTPPDIYEKPADRFVADFIGETCFLSGRLVEQRGEFGVVDIGGGVAIKAAWLGEMLPDGSEITVAIRPEKVGLIPAEGEVRKEDGARIPAQAIRSSLEQSPETTLLRARVVNGHYIGTDTRYTVHVGNTELIARVQNFSHRYDTNYRVGQDVYVFWDTQNARILSR
jgi:spermidine/putrescine transport system ATP-binding protein